MLMLNSKTCYNIGTFFVLLYVFFFQMMNKLLNFNLVLMAGFFFLFLSVIFSPKGKISFNTLLICAIMLFIGISIVRFALKSSSSGSVMDVLMTSVPFVISVVLIFSLQAEDYKFIIRLVIIFSLINAAATLYFYFDAASFSRFIEPLYNNNSESIISHTQSGLTGNFTTNAIYLSLGLLSVFGITATYKKEKNKYWIAALILLSVTLLLTAKRGHLLFSVATILFLYFLNERGKNNISKMITNIGLCLALVFIFYALTLFIPELSVIFERFTASEITNGRIPLYYAAVQMFIKNPVFGIGWGMFKFEFSSYVKLHIEYIEVHNVYLQLLAETGAAGFIVFIMFFINNIGSAVRLFTNPVYRERLTKDMISGLNFSIGIQAFFLLYCMTGNPLYDIQMYLPYCFACSVGKKIKEQVIFY